MNPKHAANCGLTFIQYWGTFYSMNPKHATTSGLTSVSQAIMFWLRTDKGRFQDQIEREEACV